MHLMHNTSVAQGPLTAFTKVLPHPVSMRASTIFLFKDTSIMNRPCSRASPTWVPRGILTQVQSMCGQSHWKWLHWPHMKHLDDRDQFLILPNKGGRRAESSLQLLSSLAPTAAIPKQPLNSAPCHPSPQPCFSFHAFGVR